VFKKEKEKKFDMRRPLQALLSPQNLKLGAEKNNYLPGRSCKRFSWAN